MRCLNALSLSQTLFYTRSPREQFPTNIRHCQKISLVPKRPSVNPRDRRSDKCSKDFMARSQTKIYESAEARDQYERVAARGALSWYAGAVLPNGRIMGAVAPNRAHK